MIEDPAGPAMLGLAGALIGVGTGAMAGGESGQPRADSLARIDAARAHLEACPPL